MRAQLEGITSESKVFTIAVSTTRAQRRQLPGRAGKRRPINIAYRPIPKLADTMVGKKSEAKAPMKVPKIQED